MHLLQWALHHATQVNIVEPFPTNPFIIGIYCGMKKPDNIEEFMHDFVTEMQLIQTNKLTVGGFTNPVQLGIPCIIWIHQRGYLINTWEVIMAVISVHEKVSELIKWHFQMLMLLSEQMLTSTDTLIQDVIIYWRFTTASFVTGNGIPVPFRFMHLVCLGWCHACSGCGQSVPFTGTSE